MERAKVTNHSAIGLTIGGVTIPAGRSALVERWDIIKDAPPVNTYLERSMITADAAPKESKAEKPKGD